MISIDVNQDFIPEAERLPQSLILSIEERLNKYIGHKCYGAIAIQIVGSQEIRRLNRIYRKKDRETDVLSFSYEDGVRSGNIGDIVISYPEAVRQAEGDVNLEITDLIVHGALHILGYDHEKTIDAEIMFPLQDAIVAESF